MTDKNYHSLCRWTFHAGKGGFLPAGIRPEWSAEKFSSADFVRLSKQISERLPSEIQLGVELHYDNEVSESNASEIADALIETGQHLAMITPGLHGHYGYGGPASLDADERKRAAEFSFRTVDIAYGALKKTWHPDAQMAPTLVLWNGSYGYDLCTLAVKDMYENLKRSVADLCKYEEKAGGKLFIGIEPKPNEGHPSMLLPTVASTILFWKRLSEQYDISLDKKGVNKEIGHSEMIGLDPILDSVEELDNNAMVHMHLNSQGLSDGIIHGGPGKFDIDHGVRVNGVNIALAGLVQQGGYKRWKGHDMQVRPYDNEQQGIDRVIRSILSWHACELAANELDVRTMQKALAERKTAVAEDMMRHALVAAQNHFDTLYAA